MSSELSAEHFRGLHESEAARLIKKAEEWEKVIEADEFKKNENISDMEDLLGQIHAAVGKTRLLIAPKGRFGQFLKLVDDCAQKRGEKPTTVMDLQGFWDLVTLQVELLDNTFKALEARKADNWKPAKEEEKPAAEKKEKRKSAGGGKPKIKVTAAPNNELKEVIAARRMELKSPGSKPATPKEDPVSKIANAEKLFEGGFFSVRSPLRTLDPAATAKIIAKTTPSSGKAALKRRPETDGEESGIAAKKPTVLEFDQEK